VLTYGFPASALALGQRPVIRGGVPVYVHPDEPTPVRQAVSDLLRDLENVFGQASLLVDTLPANAPAIVVATGDRYRGRMPAARGWEAHQVYADGNRVVLNGADLRGTIYAVYTFSESFLGVKPLWRWTSEKPTPTDQVAIPDRFHLAVPPPSIKYRAWFPKDRKSVV